MPPQRSARGRLSSRLSRHCSDGELMEYAYTWRTQNQENKKATPQSGLNA